MRTTSALKTAALLIAAVVLALGTVQGSLAVWNATARSTAGTIQAADFTVTLKSGSGPEQPLSVNGKPSTVAMPAITGLMPNDSRTIWTKVTNATNSGSGNFGIRLTTSVANDTKAPLTTTAWFSASDKCSGTAASVQLAEGGFAYLCVKATLAKDAPATFGNQKNNFSVRLTASQI